MCEVTEQSRRLWMECEIPRVELPSVLIKLQRKTPFPGYVIELEVEALEGAEFFHLSVYLDKAQTHVDLANGQTLAIGEAIAEADLRDLLVEIATNGITVYA